jgi:hypothetical protein
VARCKSGLDEGNDNVNEGDARPAPLFLGVAELIGGLVKLLIGPSSSSGTSDAYLPYATYE